MAIIDNLVSYWSLGEASGNALDAHGSNELVETSGTIDSATGKVGNCRDFEAGDTEYFVHADNADLSTGDIDFTFNLWLQLESVGANRMAVAKYNATGNQREYRIGYLTASNRLFFGISSSGASAQIVEREASTFGAPSTGVWYMLTCWHDSVNNQLGIAVNAGTADTTNHSAGVFDGTADFIMGDAAALTTPWDGLLDEVGFWKRVLTSDERTWLYNGGNGRSYADIVAGMSGAVVGVGLTRSVLLGRRRLVG